MSSATPSRSSIRKHLAVGIAVTVFLVVGVGGWAATTSLSGAIVGRGTIVVDSYVKRIQHATGGVVAVLNVHNGDSVVAGDVLLRLDDTQIQVNLAIVEKKLDELAIRGARLEAERTGLASIVVPDDLETHRTDASVRNLLESERRLFEARQSMRLSQEAQLNERIAQLENEIVGVEAQIAGNIAEAKLVANELGGVKSLEAKGLVPITRANTLGRNLAELTGARGALVASVAQAKGKISEIRLQILQIGANLQSEVAKEIGDLQAEMGEYVERQIAAKDNLRQIDIRAPQNGIVHDLIVHTVGAVVTGGEVIMQIVPVADNLVTEVKIAPQDIDQISLGKPTTLHFSAFNQRTTPVIAGVVSGISADLTYDAATRASFYLIRIAADDKELAKLGELVLLPGMPVEAFIQTEERTALSYLAKPLTDQIERAFREE